MARAATAPKTRLIMETAALEAPLEPAEVEAAAAAPVVLDPAEEISAAPVGLNTCGR